jgi:hypothetical protein
MPNVDIFSAAQFGNASVDASLGDIEAVDME